MKTLTRQAIRNNRGTLAAGLVALVLIGMVGSAILLLVFNLGMVLTVQQKANLVARNAAEDLAKRANWLGVEKGVASPMGDALEFVRASAALQGLPAPHSDNFTLTRTGENGLVFTVSYVYDCPLVGGIPVLGRFATMHASGTYDRTSDCAGLMLRVVRANGTAIFIPSYGLSGPNAIGRFTEPDHSFAGYFFWSTAPQQIESEKKPAGLS